MSVNAYDAFIFSKHAEYFWSFSKKEYVECTNKNIAYELDNGYATKYNKTGYLSISGNEGYVSHAEILKIQDDIRSDYSFSYNKNSFIERFKKHKFLYNESYDLNPFIQVIYIPKVTLIKDKENGNEIIYDSEILFQYTTTLKIQKEYINNRLGATHSNTYWGYEFAEGETEFYSDGKLISLEDKKKMQGVNLDCKLGFRLSDNEKYIIDEMISFGEMSELFEDFGTIEFGLTSTQTASINDQTNKFWKSLHGLYNHERPFPIQDYFKRMRGNVTVRVLNVKNPKTKEILAKAFKFKYGTWNEKQDPEMYRSLLAEGLTNKWARPIYTRLPYSYEKFKEVYTVMKEI